MSGPPPLTMDLGSGLRERALCAVIWALAFLVLGLWIQSRVVAPVGWWWIAVDSGLGAALGWQLARPMRGQLGWEGSAWWWRERDDTPARALGALSLSIDFGHAVVLRAPKGRWCLITRRDAGAQWHGLQLALRLGRAP
ncbi:MAG: hypothetical protein IPP44_27950 [Ideonella sp.]|jgi:hypothetical protein|nr:hypothetical protein [Ideonella sp.]